ncbi:MAG TPA: type IV pilin biogenesis protein [Nannocystaceae bacterium]|nr:type IV pilin biogenesis protein [Nannocystaceae bacterium]
MLRAVLGMLLLAAIWIGTSVIGHARVKPYYVVQGIGTGSIKPRVLFVLDTSGSMAFRAQSTEDQCLWNECEGTGTTTQSRISTARKAIKQVVATLADNASFALMTFEQNRPPASSTVPAKCKNGNRFYWTTSYAYFYWDTIKQFTGYNGTWRLCDDTNRPYPYLRWDNLGVGPVITANNKTGAVPASPLISTASASRQSTSNATRKVQWFPRFMGVRANLNVLTDPDGSILAGTVGDWAKTAAERTLNVKGQDFYYWPYVDGFPGYSQYLGSPAESGTSNMPLGVMESGGAQAGLYAPFYLDLPLTVPAADRGPASLTDASTAVLNAVSPIIEGGVDAEAGTPWASVIGASTVTPPQSNAIYSHSTVTSYLKYVTTVTTSDACAPTIAVLVTDGQPSSGEGGAKLHQRLASLRKDLGVKTYVVGFFLNEPELHNMACAAAGACNGSCETPCKDTSVNKWDTCASTTDPANGCAYLASNGDQLAKVLGTIVSSALAVEVGSGPGERMQEYGVGASGEPGKGSIVQTNVHAHTEWPAWHGHVVRELCTDKDPANPSKTAPWCVNHAFAAAEIEETFGPCPQSRVWDAGQCLSLTKWTARRIYSHKSDHTVFRISDDKGLATPEFKAQLVELGLVKASDINTQADAIAAFMLGRDFANGWKLPGLANSAPVVVRRIPKYQAGYSPSVSIRDPHCAGRQLSEVDAAGIPDSLEHFAQDAWDDSERLASPSSHRPYQEAVMIGDDLGILHAFQLDSGNELFGFVPRFTLAAAVAQWKNGAAAMGQPLEIANHIYGVAATINQGWAYDSAAQKWRHLGIFGLGSGGTELIALDLSHMSPSSPDGPVEVLWTTEDAALKSSYDKWAGETWARPAIAYDVPNNQLALEPTARLVIGSGYPKSGADSEAGRTMIYADAVTGAILDHAVLPTAPKSYESSFGALVDPALGSHCISRYWGEMEEAYIADPSGRLFRWDLGNKHAADSGATWGTSAIPAQSFLSCEGSGATCTVGAGGRGDPFIFPAAVTAGGRIDPPGGARTGELPRGIDQFLVALASGSPADDTLTTTVSSFHSSLYLIADDHSKNAHGGFDIPNGAPKSDPSALTTQKHFARIAVTDLTRTRVFTPFTGGTTYTETAKFGRATRPIRAPRIEVKGVVDQKSVGAVDGPKVIDGVEVYTVTYTLYEPPPGKCDARFFDKKAGEWHADEGATYEVKLRVTAIAGAGFDFTTGANGGAAKFAKGYAPGLTLESVQQVTTSTCADGNCGPKIDTPKMTPCDANIGSSGGAIEQKGFALPMGTHVLDGFTPIE